MPTRGKPRKTGVRADIIPVSLPRQSGEFEDIAEQQREVAADAVGDVDRLVGVVDADVDVGAEDQLLLGDPAELGGQLLVAGPIDDQLVLVERRGVGAGGADRQPVALGATSRTSRRSVAQLARRLGDVRAGQRSRSRAPTASAPA